MRYTFLKGESTDSSSAIEVDKEIAFLKNQKAQDLVDDNSPKNNICKTNSNNKSKTVTIAKKIVSYRKRRKLSHDILNQFKHSLESVEDCFNESYFEAIDSIINCKGKLITTGMGKAGIAMRKFSATLCSLGTPSCYLHPGEASHGDLGVIGKDDILFVASTSGKTREIIEVITLSKQINNNPIIGLTSHPDSIIRSKADVILDMGNCEEAGSLKMAPTTSILIMQAITDTIALVVAEEKGFSKLEFSKYHHAGYLGDLARKD